MNKIKTLDEVLEMIKDGQTIMFGGFLACGTAESIVDGIVKKGVKDLTIICNDTSYVDKGVGKLVANKQVKKVIGSHFGTNAETGAQMAAGTLEVEPVPQGTLAERVRAGGMGIGGILTPTGVGTVVQGDKPVIEVDGKKFLLEKPLRADVAVIGGTKVDKKGNVWYKAATRNFNPLMALAADVVIVEAEELVEVGEIPAEDVATPHVVVNYIVRRAK